MNDMISNFLAAESQRAIDETHQAYLRRKLKTEKIFMLVDESLDECVKAFPYMKKSVLFTLETQQQLSMLFDAEVKLYRYQDGECTALDVEHRWYPCTGAYLEFDNGTQRPIDCVLDSIFPELIKHRITNYNFKMTNGHTLLWFDLLHRNDAHKDVECYAFGGFGDVFVMLPVIYYLYNKNSSILVLTNNKGNKKIIEKFITGLRVIDFSGLNGSYKTLKRISNYTNHKPVFLFPNSKKIVEKLSNNSRIQTLYEYLCGEYIKEKPEKAYADFQKSIKLVKESHYEAIIDRLKPYYNYVITMQRKSSSTDRDGTILKEWDATQAYEFLRLCHQNRIAVLNIEPSEDSAYYDIDCGNLSIVECIDLLQQADAHIGVDSCFSFACSLLGKPSFTLFTSKNALANDFSPYYIPMSDNYSFFSQTQNPDSFQAGLIFEKVYSVLQQKQFLEKRFVPFCDRKEGVHYDYI